MDYLVCFSVYWLRIGGLLSSRRGRACWARIFLWLSYFNHVIYSFDLFSSDILEMCDRSKRKELAEKEKDLFEKERVEKKTKKAKKIVKEEEDEDEVRIVC